MAFEIFKENDLPNSTNTLSTEQHRPHKFYTWRANYLTSRSVTCQTVLLFTLIQCLVILFYEMLPSLKIESVILRESLLMLVVLSIGMYCLSLGSVVYQQAYKIKIEIFEIIELETMISTIFTISRLITCQICPLILVYSLETGILMSYSDSMLQEKSMMWIINIACGALGTVILIILMVDLRYFSSGLPCSNNSLCMLNGKVDFIDKILGYFIILCSKIGNHSNLSGLFTLLSFSALILLNFLRIKFPNYYFKPAATLQSLPIFVQTSFLAKKILFEQSEASFVVSIFIQSALVLLEMVLHFNIVDQMYDPMHILRFDLINTNNSFSRKVGTGQFLITLTQNIIKAIEANTSDLSGAQQRRSALIRPSVLNLHRSICNRVNCSCKGELHFKNSIFYNSDHSTLFAENLRAHIAICREYLQQRMANYPNNQQLKEFYIFFLSNYCNKILHARILSREVYKKSSSLTILQSYQYKQMKKQLTTGIAGFLGHNLINVARNIPLENNLVMIKVLSIQKRYARLHSDMSYSLRLRQRLSSQLQSINGLDQKLILTSQKLGTVENSLLRQLSTLKDMERGYFPRHLYYEQFFRLKIREEIYLEKRSAIEFRRLTQQYKKHSKDLKLHQLLMKMESESKLALLMIDFQHRNTENFCFISQNCEKAIRYNIETLRGKSINQILPGKYKSFHQHLLRTSRGFDEISSRPELTTSLFENRNGYLSKCYLRVGFVPSVNHCYLGAFISEQDDCDFLVMIEKDGLICGVSREASNFFNIDQSNVRLANLNINYLSKKFDDISAALNLAIALRIPKDQYGLYFSAQDITLILSKKVSRLQDTIRKLKRGFYLNFKDPFRKELNGKIIPIDDKFDLQLGSSCSDSLENSSSEYVEPTGVQIVQGLLEVQIHEVVSSTFDIVRVLDFKKLIGTKSELSTILGSSSQKGVLDPDINFILEIDTSVCGMKPRKPKIPKNLQIENSLLTNANKFRFLKYESDAIEKVKHPLHQKYFDQLRNNSETFFRALFVDEETLITTQYFTNKSFSLARASTLKELKEILPGYQGEQPIFKKLINLGETETTKSTSKTIRDTMSDYQRVKLRKMGKSRLYKSKTGIGLENTMSYQRKVIVSKTIRKSFSKKSKFGKIKNKLFFLILIPILTSLIKIGFDEVFSTAYFRRSESLVKQMQMSRQLEFSIKTLIFNVQKRYLSYKFKIEEVDQSVLQSTIKEDISNLDSSMNALLMTKSQFYEPMFNRFYHKDEQKRSPLMNSYYYHQEDGVTRDNLFDVLSLIRSYSQHVDTSSTKPDQAAVLTDMHFYQEKNVLNAVMDNLQAAIPRNPEYLGIIQITFTLMISVTSICIYITLLCTIHSYQSKVRKITRHLASINREELRVFVNMTGAQLIKQLHDMRKASFLSESPQSYQESNMSNSKISKASSRWASKDYSQKSPYHIKEELTVAARSKKPILSKRGKLKIKSKNKYRRASKVKTLYDFGKKKTFLLIFLCILITLIYTGLIFGVRISLTNSVTEFSLASVAVIKTADMLDSCFLQSLTMAFYIDQNDLGNRDLIARILDADLKNLEKYSESLISFSKKHRDSRLSNIVLSSNILQYKQDSFLELAKNLETGWISTVAYLKDFFKVYCGIVGEMTKAEEVIAVIEKNNFLKNWKFKNSEIEPLIKN